MTSNGGHFAIDANVIVSAAILPVSTPRRAFDHARSTGIILLSDSLFEELEDGFARPKFDRYLSIERRAEFLSLIKWDAATVTISVSITACRDPKDNHILELAVSRQATCIITGDDDLLALHPFQGISILSPSDFLDTSVPVASEPPATEPDA